MAPKFADQGPLWLNKESYREPHQVTIMALVEKKNGTYGEELVLEVQEIENGQTTKTGQVSIWTSSKDYKLLFKELGEEHSWISKKIWLRACVVGLKKDGTGKLAWNVGV